MALPLMLLAAVAGEAMLSSLLLIAKPPLLIVPPLLLAVVAGEATKAVSKSISLNIRFSYTNLPAAIHSAA
jgi:hypothetical protein